MYKVSNLIIIGRTCIQCRQHYNQTIKKINQHNAKEKEEDFFLFFLNKIHSK